MEIMYKVRNAVACLVLCGLMFACQLQNWDLFENNTIHPSEHVLLSLVPHFSVKVKGDSLHKQYPYLNMFNVFPVTGSLLVNGKNYRFMGGDWQRDKALAPLTSDKYSWKAKYSFLYPGQGWMNVEYDDTQWWDGMSAFGSEDYSYPTHTVWDAFNIYVRRHFNIADKNSLKGRQLYVKYICDDKMRLYLNGELVVQADNFMFWPNSDKLPERIWEKLREGDNVLAACGQDVASQALLDYGLYIRNTSFHDVDTACLRGVKVGVAQTSYQFQCGNVELWLDFSSPSLLNKTNMTGCPIGIISYRVEAKDGKLPDVEIMFDLDVEGMFDKSKTQHWVEQDWRIVKSDSLYLGVKATGSNYSYMDNHVILSQKMCGKNDDRGVLLLGYEEGEKLQYAGESLLPFWNKDGNRKLKDILQSIGGNYNDLKEECGKMDSRWNKDISLGVDNVYMEYLVMSYRNFVANHRFMSTSDRRLLCFGDNLGSVREAYNNFLVLLFFGRTDWIKGLLDPVFEYCETGYWVKKYPPYDIGKYPAASYQREVNNNGIESAADMLIMIAALVKAEKDFDYADLHWAILCQWAEYLKDSKTEEIAIACDLLDEEDKRVKRILGLMAYQELVCLKEKY